MIRSGRARVLMLGLLSIVGQASAVSGCGGSLGGPGGTGGVSGGAGDGVLGGAGGGGAGGTQMVWQQVSCSVLRTECSGWAENGGVGVDGTDVSCPASNLVDNSFVTSICFQTPLGSTFEEQFADAQQACNTWCDGSGGFHGLYPLGALAKEAGSGVTCAAQPLYQGTQALPGRCDSVSGPSAGKTEYALCTLSGRQCASPTTSSDGTEYCASLPPLTVDASGCFDPTMTNAQEFCAHGWLFFGAGPGGTTAADEFPYWSGGAVEPYVSPEACTAAALAASQ